MEYIYHDVRRRESIFDVAKKYNVTVNMIQNLNCVNYPKIIDYPYMIFYGWTLLIPLVSNGGNTQYDLV